MTREYWRLSSVADLEPILKCHELVAGYGGSTVLNGISLQAMRTCITGIVGPNGAGKSTFLKALLGFVPSSGGRISFKGADITHVRPNLRIAAGIAYVAQAHSAFKTMTVWENLRLGAYLTVDKQTVAERHKLVLNRFPELAARLNNPASDLSGGQLRMLEIGRFLMQGPDLVILDEPSIGLSPALIDLVYSEIRRLALEGMTFLIVEQNVKKLLTVANYVYAFESGRNHLDGAPEQLQREGVMQTLYLGASLDSEKSK
jgi:branched-chain amino acid transport system ATP-binding protein